MMYMLCPGGCHHYEPVSLIDSRPAAEAMVRHIIGPGPGPGRHGGRVWSRADARTAVNDCQVVSGYWLRTRFEKQCRTLHDHPPHGDRFTGCYGNGPFRKVPELPVRTARTEDVESGSCPYTFAHTRTWCGYDGCREA